MKAVLRETGEKKFGKKEYTVCIVQDCQSFFLDYTGTKRECKWMIDMFHVALKKHDAGKK